MPRSHVGIFTHIGHSPITSLFLVAALHRGPAAFPLHPTQALGKSPSSMVGVGMPSARISTIGFVNSRSR